MRRERERQRKKRLGKEKEESPRRSLGGKQRGAEGQEWKGPGILPSSAVCLSPTPY